MSTVTGLRTQGGAKTATRQTASAHQLLRAQLLECAFVDLRDLVVSATEANPLLELNEEGELAFDREQAIGLMEGAEPAAAERAEGHGLVEGRLRRAQAPSVDDLRDLAAEQAGGDDFRIDLRLAVRPFMGSRRERLIADAIIDMIDERGLFIGNPSAIAAKLGCEPADVTATLEKIQEGLHNGIGARDAVEAACLQIPDPEERALARAVLTANLNDVKAGRLAKIAAEQGVSKKRISEFVAGLSELSALPAGADTARETVYIYPDIVARSADGELDVQVAGSSVPPVRMSDYEKLLDAPSLSPDERSFISSRAREASDFIAALAARGTLMERFARLLAERERPFLMGAAPEPEPLDMQEVADQLGVSMSTVSRLCKNKYILCDRGMRELGSFFKKSFVTVDTARGKQQMREAEVSKMVKDMIAAENPDAPLSDQQIADRIGAETGVKLARRTVAKHRANAGIPNSSVRRIR